MSQKQNEVRVDIVATSIQIKLKFSTKNLPNKSCDL